MSTKHITTKQYQIMTDQFHIWDFMTEIYDRKWVNGVAAPFYEYAITSSWMDISYLYLNRIWFDGEKIVAFMFDESPVTDIFFSLRPGYEALADEMVAYADQYMPNFNHRRRFVLFEGQSALFHAAAKLGYVKEDGCDDMQFDFRDELNYPLPTGFSYVEPKNFDPVKLAICCWKGFDHEQDKGPFVNWDGPDTGTPWNPPKAMRGVSQSTQAPPPHSTQEYDLIIQNDQEDYVCYSGMWWVPQNKLAYMEPLCTVPEYRRMGLASAALSAHYHRMKALGATHMTGGSNDFYKKIGYRSAVRWTFWKKPENP